MILSLSVQIYSCLVMIHHSFSVDLLNIGENFLIFAVSGSFCLCLNSLNSLETSCSDENFRKRPRGVSKTVSSCRCSIKKCKAW